MRRPRDHPLFGFPVSAIETEIDYDHGVTIVTIDGDPVNPPRVEIEHAPLARSTPCLRIPSRGALPLGEVEASFAALRVDPATPEGERPYVHLCVALDGPAVGVKSEIDAIAGQFPIRLVSLSIERPQKDDEHADGAARLAPCGARPWICFAKPSSANTTSRPQATI